MTTISATHQEMDLGDQRQASGIADQGVGGAQIEEDGELFLAEKSRQQTERGNTTNGILLALEALPQDMVKPDRPYAGLYQATFERRELRVLEGHTDRVTSAAFSPDGTRVVTASWDNTARLWDAAAGKALATLAGHTDQVTSAAFSPDGTRVVTACGDHTAKIWQVFTTTQELIDYARSTVPRQLTPEQRKAFFLE
jgi:WD40 repeat protein